MKSLQQYIFEFNKAVPNELFKRQLEKEFPNMFDIKNSYCVGDPSEGIYTLELKCDDHTAYKLTHKDDTEFKRFVKKFGYHFSEVIIDGDNTYIVVEPDKANEVTNKIYNKYNGIVYHVARKIKGSRTIHKEHSDIITLFTNIENDIISKGLIPKQPNNTSRVNKYRKASKDRIKNAEALLPYRDFDEPKVYCFFADKDNINDEIELLAGVLGIDDDNLTILKIDLNKLDYKITFYKDTYYNTSDSWVYTYSPIDPKCITKIK